MNTDQRETKDWIKAMASHMGLSPSRLALNAGMAASTVTRFLNDHSGKVGITQSTLESIAAYTGFRPHQFPGRGRMGVPEPDAVPLHLDSYVPPHWIQMAASVLTNAGRGVEAWVMKGAALDGLGILPNDVLLIDTKAKPKTGDVVLAQVLDYSTRTEETIMRVYQAPFVVAHSIRLGPVRPEHVDEDRVRIAGTSIGVLRARH